MNDKKVMIIDDDREFLEELDETLKLSGYQSIPVSAVDEAIAIARSAKPDVIVLDLKMPVKSGFQLAMELRDVYELAETPIIAMSAHYKAEYASLLGLCGIVKCLKKPFSPLDIIAQIEETMKGPAAPGGSGCPPDEGR